MTRIVVLFNLKSGTSPGDYEAWAKSTDLPVVRGLKSVDGFDVLRATGVMGSDAPAPYAYVEIIDVPDMGAFRTEVANEAMQKVAGEFRAFADNPVFILTESLDGESGA
ncbi:MAG: REDY-like protein HapK [Pseudomonadota bacterium]